MGSGDVPGWWEGRSQRLEASGRGGGGVLRNRDDSNSGLLRSLEGGDGEILVAGGGLGNRRGQGCLETVKWGA